MSSGAAFTVFRKQRLRLPELRLWFFVWLRLSSGVAFGTSVAAFMHIRVAFAAQSRHSSGNGFRSAASFLKTCTVNSRIELD